MAINPPVTPGPGSRLPGAPPGGPAPGPAFDKVAGRTTPLGEDQLTPEEIRFLKGFVTEAKRVLQQNAQAQQPGPEGPSPEAAAPPGGPMSSPPPPFSPPGGPQRPADMGP